MKNILFSVLLFVSQLQAGDLTAQNIRDRLEIRADIYLMDESGKRVLQGPMRSNYWRINPDTKKIDGHWSSNFEENDQEAIGLHVTSEVSEDGTIGLGIQEYTTKKEKKDFAIENLAPVIWKVTSVKNKNYIVRFIPALREINEPTSVDSLPIAGTGISIYDNQGFIWAEKATFNGKYSGVTSHRGTLALSYTPFKGSRELGVAEGNQITLNLDKKLNVYIKSSGDFLPAGVTAKVYAAYNLEKRTKSFTSLHSFDTSKEERLQGRLK